MGLVGALVVRPAGFDPASPTVYGAGTGTGYSPGQEYLHLFTQLDPDLHHAVELALAAFEPLAYDFTTYHPRYYMINGRSFPDTTAPNHAGWIPDQPYSALIRTRPQGNPADGYQSGPSLIRYLNAGPVNYPFHPHSDHERVIGIDGEQLVGAGGDLSYDTFAIDVQPAQTLEAFFAWTNVDNWGTGVGQQTIEGPFGDGVIQPDSRNQLVGPYWSGSPYLGGEGFIPSGGDGFNECGEHYHVAHSHNLIQMTTYGGAFGGLLTLVRVDPPTGCE